MASSSARTTVGGQLIGLYTDEDDIFLYINGTDADSALASFSYGVWYHIVMMRSGSTIYGFLDGTQILSAAFTGTALGTSTPELGFVSPSDNSAFIDGFSSWRVSTVAMYSTAGFTRPSLPLD